MPTGPNWRVYRSEKQDEDPPPSYAGRKLPRTKSARGYFKSWRSRLKKTGAPRMTSKEVDEAEWRARHPYKGSD